MYEVDSFARFNIIANILNNSQLYDFTYDVLNIKMIIEILHIDVKYEGQFYYLLYNQGNRFKMETV